MFWYPTAEFSTTAGEIKNPPFRGGLLIILKCYYKFYPPPCNTGIIMTATNSTAAVKDNLSFNLCFNIKAGCNTNILLLKIKTKEL
jgi:hypothetical protein